MKIKGVRLFKGDIVIIFSIIITAVLVFALSLNSSYEQNVLEIYQDGALIKTISLSNSVNETIEFEELTVEIDGTKVRVIDSQCFDHVCENTGYIEETGEVIVCMPNKLLLKIVGEETETTYDAVVG